MRILLNKTTTQNYIDERTYAVTQINTQTNALTKLHMIHN